MAPDPRDRRNPIAGISPDALNKSSSNSFSFRICRSRFFVNHFFPGDFYLERRFDIAAPGMTKRVLSFFAAFALLVSFVSAADISITPASVIPSAKARFSQQTAGVTITAGQVVYLDTVSGTVKLAKANVASPVNSVFGIAATNASANQPVVIITSDPALAIGGTVASGATVWLSGTNTGGETSTFADLVTGWTIIVLGVGNGSNSINFNPLTGGAM